VVGALAHLAGEQGGEPVRPLGLAGDDVPIDVIDGAEREELFVRSRHATQEGEHMFA
jgi:hypothetical protein